MEFDLENPLTSLKEHQSDDIPHLFSAESDHMPSHNFFCCFKTREFYLSFRQQAVSLIFQAQYSWDFDPFVLYLAVNYLDRFISRREIPQGKQWVTRIIAVACISLAAKMKNPKFSPSNFQKEEGIVFDEQTIHRMELVILDALNWRMRSITPFSFLSFFISLFELEDPPLKHALKAGATEIIFLAHHEIKFLEFKPSIVSGAALLLASHQLFPSQFASLKTSILSCKFVNKEKLLRCFNAMREMVVIEEYESMVDTVSSTKTPLSVLDCPSTGSETETDSTTTTTVMMVEKREIKRRRLNGYCSENRFHVSQIQRC